MALNSSTDVPISDLNSNIISLGTLLPNGSSIDVYGNFNSGIVLQDLNEDFVAIDNNIISNTKSVLTNTNTTISIPLIKNQLHYELVEKLMPLSNIGSSFIGSFPVYKNIVKEYDVNGMLLYGFRYDQDPDNTYKFKTVGIRMIHDISANGERGFRIFIQALQYDRDSDGNTTISDTGSAYNQFYPFDYRINVLTLLISTEVTNDGSDDYINFNMYSIEKNLQGYRLINIDNNNQLKLSDINLTKDNIVSCITMPELNQSIEYSLFNVKIYSKTISLEELERQAQIEIPRS